MDMSVSTEAECVACARMGMEPRVATTEQPGGVAKSSWRRTEDYELRCLLQLFWPMTWSRSDTQHQIVAVCSIHCAWRLDLASFAGYWGSFIFQQTAIICAVRKGFPARHFAVVLKTECEMVAAPDLRVAELLSTSSYASRIVTNVL